MGLFSRHVCHRKFAQIGCAPCGAPGFVAGTRISTRHGWRAVETIERATRVCTIPTGTARPTGVAAERIWLDPVDCPHVVRPLQVPPGALGNTAPFLMQQDMRVVFHDPEAADILGADAVTIRAEDLISFAGIAETQPPRRKTLVRLAFSKPVVLGVAGGARILCQPAVLDLATLAGQDPRILEIGDLTLRHLDAAEADAYLASLPCEEPAPA